VGNLRRFWALGVLTALLMSAAASQAATRSGTVDSTGATAPRWVDTLFSTSSTGTIQASLDWTSGTANLDLFLFRERSDGSWDNVAWANSATSRPETLKYANAPAGQYRLGVQAKSGTSAYTLSYSAATSVPQTTGGGYLTLLFSRSDVTAADDCVENDTGVARLDTVVAPELARRGLTAVGSVQTGNTNDTALSCDGTTHGRRSMQASWAVLAKLRDTYGWSFVSHSASYAINLGSLSPAQQYAETCGSLQTLEAHGHHRADGLFLYPNNKWTLQVQEDYVAKCYAFGRQYGDGITTRIDAGTYPYWQSTRGIPGGRCNNPALTCATLNTFLTYRSPVAVEAEITSLGAGEWLTLQSYLLVTGYRPGLWDCRADDWHDHWTTDAERYCYRDYLQILNAIPGTVTVTDPKTVAQAWGRTNYTPPAP
jgi:hypothetical protein